MNKDFRTFAEAQAYALAMKSTGFKAYVEELWGFEGRYFTVLVWE